MRTRLGTTAQVWKQEWQVRFEGEAGVDWGGLQREFFTVPLFSLLLSSLELSDTQSL